MHLLYIKRTLADERVRYIKLGGEWGGVRASLLVCVVCVHTGVVDIDIDSCVSWNVLGGVRGREERAIMTF